MQGICGSAVHSRMHFLPVVLIGYDAPLLLFWQGEEFPVLIKDSLYQGFVHSMIGHYMHIVKWKSRFGVCVLVD